MTNFPLFNYFFIKKIPFFRRFLFRYLLKWVKNNETQNVITTVLNGVKMNLFVNDWVQQNLFVYGIYEKNETKYWISKVKTSQIIFDIGTNVGYYSLIAAKQIKKNNGNIYAFEPIKKTYNRLKENIELNSFKCIQAFNVAVSDKEGEIKINIGDNKNWGMSSLNEHDYLSGEFEIVKKIAIDDFCKEQEIKSIDLIKIDVEGAEFMVLKGMETSLNKFKPEILIEIFEPNLKKQNITPADVFNFLWNKGYKSYKIKSDSTLDIILHPISQEGLVCFRAD